MSINKVVPIPESHGIGFCSMTKLDPKEVIGYREQQIGQYWNYYFTSGRWGWPVKITNDISWKVIDGFSPNLNKELHVGHLRNLALAVSLSRTLGCEMVSLLGTSLGIQENAEKKLKDWFQFLDYKPQLYYDTELPGHVDFQIETDPNSHFKDAGIWIGPKGPVIVVRSDGRKTYAYYDLVFAKTVTPDYYVTGAEQKQHFESLGLGDKHLPMGLVLGKTEKGWAKLKSRDGNAMSAEGIMQEIVEYLKKGNLEKTKEPLSEEEYHKLAWNVISWNLLHVSRAKDVKFEPEKWTNPKEPGLYISYTYARVSAAIKANPIVFIMQPELTQVDINLVGFASYFDYYYARAIETLEATPLAGFAHELARRMGTAYESELIGGGRSEFHYAMKICSQVLGKCMKMLGMFDLERV